MILTCYFDDTVQYAQNKFRPISEFLVDSDVVIYARFTVLPFTVVPSSSILGDTRGTRGSKISKKSPVLTTLFSKITFFTWHQRSKFWLSVHPRPPKKFYEQPKILMQLSMDNPIYLQPKPTCIFYIYSKYGQPEILLRGTTIFSLIQTYPAICMTCSVAAPGENKGICHPPPKKNICLAPA